jgi:hypothetical protein
MHAKLGRILVIFVLMISNSVHADNDHQIFRGRDISAIVQYFSYYLRTVQKPFYLYHWRSDQELARSADAQANPEKYGTEIVNRDAQNFIPGLYVKLRSFGNVYGGGLYAAIDPQLTEGYGGSDPTSTALLAMHIPIGFHVLDLRLHEPTFSQSELSQLNTVLSEFQCSNRQNQTGDNSFLSNLLSGDFTKDCADLLSHVLLTLKVDGFFYEYGSTPYSVCQQINSQEVALVFVSSSWLQLPNAHAYLFTPQSRGALKERQAIESTFYLAHTLHGLSGPAYDSDGQILDLLIKKHIPENAKSINISAEDAQWSSSNYMVRIVVSYSIGDANKTDVLKFDSSDFESLQLTEYPNRFSSRPEIYFSHWSDLIGTPTIDKPSIWLKENIFECGDSEFLSHSESWRTNGNNQ